MNDRQSKSQFSKFNVTNHLSYRLKKREPIFNRIDLVNHSISSIYVFKIHRRLPERATSKKSKKPATRSRGVVFQRSVCSLHRLPTDAETVAILKIEGPSSWLLSYIYMYICMYERACIYVYMYITSGRGM